MGSVAHGADLLEFSLGRSRTHWEMTGITSFFRGFPPPPNISSVQGGERLTGRAAYLRWLILCAAYAGDLRGAPEKGRQSREFPQSPSRFPQAARII